MVGSLCHFQQEEIVTLIARFQVDSFERRQVTGLDADWGRGFSTRIAYSGDFRSDFVASTFSGSVRLKF